jgi:lysophospholipase L1-like esterase
MIGDSITEGGVWSEMFPEIRIANRGVHGDSTKAIVQRMDSILSVQPRKAFIMAGINDINEGTPLETIFQNYLKIIRQLRAEKITVHIQSTIECSRNLCGEHLDQVRKLNKKLLHYALSNNIVFIDLNEGLTSVNDGLLDKFTVDGVHLRGGAYINWRRKIAPFILGDSPNGKRPGALAESAVAAENRTESGLPAFDDKPPENEQKTF